MATERSMETHQDLVMVVDMEEVLMTPMMEASRTLVVLGRKRSGE